MSLVDNRTRLQDCEAAADVSGDTSAAPTGTSNIVGTVVQGSNSIEFQVADAQEVLLFDQDQAGSTFNVDMSDMTIYMIIKYNLGELFGNVGGLIAFGDGADGAGGDIVGYAVNGADIAGFPYEFRFGVMKLDVSVIVAAPGSAGTDHFVYNGTEAGLDHTAVLQIGYGSFGLVKAVSTAKNAWCDGIYYILNSVSSVTGYALTIEGGTVGTPETMVDVAADDITAGLGMVNNPKGTEYGFFAPTQWGNPPAGTSDSYFTSTDTQWFWIGDNQGGHIVADTHFPFRLVGNSTGINSWVITRVVIVGVSTRAQFDMSDADMDFVQMNSCTLVDIGAINCNVANDVDKFWVATILVNCDQVDPGLVNMDQVTFNGSNDATGALLLDETQHNRSDLTDLTFNSDGSGYGVRLRPTGAGPFVYNFDNWQNSGYGADDTADAFIDVDPVTSTALITINLQNGAGTITTDTTSLSSPSNLTITNAQTIEANGMTEGAAVKFIANETVGSLTVGDVIAEILADSNGVAALTTFNYEGAFGAGVDIIVRAAQNGLPNAAVADDGAVLTDETMEANSSTDDDMTLTPDNPQDVNDAYYLGHSEQFINGPNGTIRFKLEVSVAHTAGEPTIVWEFWNGAWVALTFTDADPNPNFGSVGEFIYEFDAEAGWIVTTINSQGPFYYVRARVSVAGTSTLGAAGRFATLDVTKYFRQDLKREVLPAGLTTTVPWNINSLALFDPAND